MYESVSESSHWTGYAAGSACVDSCHCDSPMFCIISRLQYTVVERVQPRLGDSMVSLSRAMRTTVIKLCCGDLKRTMQQVMLDWVSKSNVQLKRNCRDSQTAIR